MVVFFLSLAAIFAGAFILERLVQPRQAGARPILKAQILGALPLVGLFLIMLMISYRPILSAVGTLIAFLAIVLLNNSKFIALKEPLVYADFALFRQVVRYPQLYIKYIGLRNIAVIFLLGSLTVFFGFSLEDPIVARTRVVDFLPAVIFLAMLAGIVYALIAGPLRRPFSDFLWSLGPSQDVAADVSKLSLTATLIIYFFLSRETREAVPGASVYIPSAAFLMRDGGRSRLGSDRPGDIIAIQSESFFDARRLDPSIDRGLLSRYDELVASAYSHGMLSVPAWGANTMRTEFSFLTGMANEDLGFHRFNPFLSLAKSPVWSLARALKMLGYRTICVHPYHSTFFDRHEVYPALGFDELLDIEAFPDAATFGPYISDEAVADKIVEVLGQSEQPAFIFAITMENHGRWEKNRFEPSEMANRTRLSGNINSLALEFYLKHLANTDRLLTRLSDEMMARSNEAVLCLFGDHLPSFPKLFRSLGYEDDRVDYLVWRRGGGAGRNRDLRVEVLGSVVLEAAGITLETEAAAE